LFVSLFSIIYITLEASQYFQLFFSLSNTSMVAVLLRSLIDQTKVELLAATTELVAPKYRPHLCLDHNIHKVISYIKRLLCAQ